jgi:hypothetical protein
MCSHVYRTIKEANPAHPLSLFLAHKPAVAHNIGSQIQKPPFNAGSLVCEYVRARMDSRGMYGRFLRLAGVSDDVGLCRKYPWVAKRTRCGSDH